MTLKEYCEVSQDDRLLLEWEQEKNQGLSPETLTPDSHRRIWWRCKEGHLWNTEVKDRVRGNTGCPYCSGRLPIIGKNDLVTVAPEIALEWHPTKNGEKKPEQFTAGSEQKVWWRCVLGHEWQATIENRVIKKNQCPYCSGKKAWPGFNDFATLHPELLEEWHPDLNIGLDPLKLRPGAKKRVYWICSEGHVWDTWLFSRTSRKRPGCPYCAGNAKKVKERCKKYGSQALQYTAKS